MDAFIRVARMAAVKEPRDAVALQAGEAHRFAEHEVEAADGVRPEIERPVERAEDLVAQLRRDALVGVDDEDPIVRGAVDGVVLRRCSAEVFALLDANAGELLADQLEGAIRRERIEEVDLVGPVDGAEAVLDVVDLIEDMR